MQGEIVGIFPFFLDNGFKSIVSRLASFSFSFVENFSDMSNMRYRQKCAVITLLLREGVNVVYDKVFTFNLTVLLIERIFASLLPYVPGHPSYFNLRASVFSNYQLHIFSWRADSTTEDGKPDK